MAAGGEGLMRRWIRGFGLLYLCIRGPRLYRVYRVNGRAAIGRGRPMQEGDVESSWVRDLWRIIPDENGPAPLHHMAAMPASLHGHRGRICGCTCV